MCSVNNLDGVVSVLTVILAATTVSSASAFGRAESKADLLAVVGVFSGAGDKYVSRRNLLRSTWFPATGPELVAMRTSNGIDMRFVMGNPADAEAGRRLDLEERQFGAFFRVNVTEGYSSLPAKVWQFLRLALEGPSFRYVLKVDDDVYFRPQALPSGVLGSWGSADYVACFRRRGKIRHIGKFFEYGAPLLGRSYYTYATGSTYALSSSAAALVVSLPLHSLRILGCGDDCSVGLWLLAFNASFLEDRALCQWDCTSPSSISIRHQGRCGGLCNAARDIPRLHDTTSCRAPAPPPDNRRQLVVEAPEPQEPSPAAAASALRGEGRRYEYQGAGAAGGISSSRGMREGETSLAAAPLGDSCFTVNADLSDTALASPC